MRRLVGVPLSTPQVEQLASGCLRNLAGFAATETQMAAFGLDPASADDLEMAEYQAVCIASVVCLLRGDRRIVATAILEVEPGGDEISGGSFGEVVVAELAAEEVVAVFVDEPEALGAAEAASHSVQGLDLSAAWESPPVSSLFAEHGLLWHSLGEIADS